VENLRIVRFREVKREIRVVGLDDGNIIRKKMGKVNLVGVIFRGGDWLDGVLRTKIKVDGFDSTNKIVNMVKNSSHYGQIRVVMLGKMFFGNTNMVDGEKIWRKLKKPIMVFVKKSLNFKKVKEKFKNSLNGEEKLDLLEKLMNQLYLDFGENRIYLYGVDVGDAEKILRVSSKNFFPESLRIASLVASALNKM